MLNSTLDAKRTARGIVWVAVLVAAAALAPATRAEKGRCASAVQRKIAWDYAGSKSWSQTNVRKLCAGAESSLQPARCFDRVMHGGVSWGESTRWESTNALELCQGTLDAEATISCFEKRVPARLPPKESISACRWRKPSPKIVLDPSTLSRDPSTLSPIALVLTFAKVRLVVDSTLPRRNHE